MFHRLHTYSQIFWREDARLNESFQFPNWMERFVVGTTFLLKWARTLVIIICSLPQLDQNQSAKADANDHFTIFSTRSTAMKAQDWTCMAIADVKLLLQWKTKLIQSIVDLTTGQLSQMLETGLSTSYSSSVVLAITLWMGQSSSTPSKISSKRKSCSTGQVWKMEYFSSDLRLQC